MGDAFPTVRVAAVQAASVFLDRERSTEKACRLIREAGAGGARLIAFPENFIPGHPYWFAFEPPASRAAMALSTELFRQSVPVPGPVTEALSVAAREAGAYVVMGLTQKVANSTGTLYNAQLVVGPNGELLGLRQKIVPTMGERIVHAPGSGAGIRTFPTDFGPISALICAENSNPLATFAMLALGARVHVASWPAFFQRGFRMQEQMDISARAIAQQNASFVISVCGAIDDDLVDRFGAADEDREFLVRERELGGSAIYAPGGSRLTGPLPGGEAVLYADLDLEQIVARKIVKDYAGHYNRSDLFELWLRPGPDERIRLTGQPPFGEGATTDPTSRPANGPTSRHEMAHAATADQPDAGTPMARRAP
jgi:nitrilase